ncbi:hypothetical protein KY349_00400, partial [Candidatus Woesearchaeota archaeon]|nr:hypothetical protein [Candidatus Woesearchaeota archaeon]
MMANSTKLAKPNQNGKNGKNGKSLEKIVGKDARGSRVYVLSEVGYDTDYFNPDAYENLLKVMAEDKDISGILIDGAVTRLDRPEFLNDSLTYWRRSEEDCMNETESIPNKRQYKNMMETQLKILEQRIMEMKERVPQVKDVVLSIDSDDMQYTISAMVNEMLLRGQKEIKESITKLRERKKKLKKDYTKMQKDYENLESMDGSGKKKAGLTKRMRTCESKLDYVEEKIKDKADEQKLYREKKVRPAHQFFTARFIRKLYRKYQGLCDRLDVTLVTNPSIIKFNDLTIDYAHSRHATWAVLKRRDKALVESTHGKSDKLKGIDVLLESGHFGIGYKQFQKLKDSPAETNFKNQSSFDSETCDDHITIVMALPFEDQEMISGYSTGKKPIRLSGGKPMNTRKIAAMDRYKNDCVNGITVITKDEDGMVGTEWIQYRNFANGSVLKQPEEYSIICASSDEHIASPEANPIVTKGWVELYNRLLKQPTSFRGRKAFAKGLINGGDVAEANSRKWDHRYHQKRDPEEVMKENLELLTRFSPDSIDKIVELAMKMTNDSMGGSVESMAVVLDRVADYFESTLNGSLEKSRLKWLQVSTTGNHSDNVLRDLGMRESDFLQQRLKERGIETYEVGRPDYFKKNPEKDARVFLGGYSNARVLNIPDYGLDIEGKPMFGPVNLVVQHDPKGSDMRGVIGAGKNAGADLSIAGHTHDNRMRLYKTGDNTWSVAYKLATLQGVSPTEKYYAGSVPRTQAAHKLVMPMPGDFSEQAIPVTYLREQGRESLRRTVEQEM